MEFRLGERWEVLDDLIPSTETELVARDLVQVSRGQVKLTEDAKLFQPSLAKPSASCDFSGKMCGRMFQKKVILLSEEQTGSVCRSLGMSFE